MNNFTHKIACIFSEFILLLGVENIELKYKSENINANHKYYKYMGLVWLILGTIEIVSDSRLGWFNLALGFAHLLVLNKESHIYATIKNGIFQKEHWFASKTDLTKANYVKKFAGDVTFVFQNKELRIEALLLDESSQAELDEFITLNEIPTKVIPVR